MMMRVAILGGGTIARLVLERAKQRELRGIELVGLGGRRPDSPAAGLAREFGLPYVVGRGALLALRPQVVLEAASHEAVREHLVALLEAGIGVVVLSAGAFASAGLQEAAERAAARGDASLYVPSGGIGGLDALKAACVAGVDEVSIQVAKPPAAWKGIPYVEKSGVDLDSLKGPHTLFDGTANSRARCFALDSAVRPASPTSDTPGMLPPRISRNTRRAIVPPPRIATRRFFSMAV